MKKLFLIVATLFLISPLAAAQTSKNLADDKPAPTVNPKMTEHSKKMVQQVYKVTDNVYSAVGFGGATL